MDGDGQQQVDPELMQFVQQAQAQAQVQQMVNQLSGLCFKKCVGKVGSSLSRAEEECASNCVRRYFDSTKEVVKAVSRASGGSS